MPERNANGSLKMTIPISVVASLVTAFGGMAGYNAVVKPQIMEAEKMPALIALQEQYKSHIAQQERDCENQRRRDENQDLRTQSVSASVDMLNTGVTRIETNTEMLQRQMSDVQSDIKKLLERRPQ
jgi:hypothetical protein